MKTLVQFLFYLSLLYSFNGYTQSRWIFNNNAFVNIENDTYLVIDNDNANAITQIGSGGNILAEKVSRNSKEMECQLGRVNDVYELQKRHKTYDLYN